MNTFDTSKQERCEQAIVLVEEKLAHKSQLLTEQIMFNGWCYIIGLVVGFIFAKTYKFVGFTKLNGKK